MIKNLFIFYFYNYYRYLKPVINTTKELFCPKQEMSPLSENNKNNTNINVIYKNQKYIIKERRYLKQKIFVIKLRKILKI